jgi:hypothetical protein
MQPEEVCGHTGFLAYLQKPRDVTCIGSRVVRKAARTKSHRLSALNNSNVFLISRRKLYRRLEV